jgi:type III secretion protein D
MYELRVLSGLHRGATLPIDDRPHTLGSSEEADVVLVDPGIEEQHATLTFTGDGWSISSLDGNVLDALSNQPQSLIDLGIGEFARIGDVWVTVVAQDAPWENPPPEPEDEPLAVSAAEEGMISVHDLQGEHEGQEGHEAYETHEAHHEQAAEPESAIPASTVSPVLTAKSRSKNGRRVITISLAVASVLSAAAYAFTSKSAQDTDKPDLRSQLQAVASGKSRPRLDAPVAEIEAAPAVANVPTEALEQAFRKRLADAELLKRFDLDLGNTEWNMKAALDDEEAARFERVLAGFVKAHNINFPIHAKVGSAEAMLPFKIRQVVTGVNAGIVTEDGTRLYVGDAYKGMRLAAIEDSRLVFTGKRRVEVKW